jgi:hypothetical protein
VKIWDTRKTLKYLNKNDSFHLKDLEISKYKWESKERWSINICLFIFVNLPRSVTWVLMRKKKPVISNTSKFFCFNNNVSNLYNNSVVEKIYGIAYVFTLLMFRKSNKTTINKNTFTWVLMRKKKPVISNTGRFFCFNSTVSYAYSECNLVTNKTTINKNKKTNIYRSTFFRFSFIFRYFKVFQVKRIVFI